MESICHSKFCTISKATCFIFIVPIFSKST